ncbi:MAG: hypothetical protein WC343_06060 [Bacilli bacterium]|jgi:hypothetical protein
MNQIAIMESKIEVLCKQLDDKDKELRAVKLAHAVEKDIMQTNFDQCKSAAEYWKDRAENLMCCGNCEKSNKFACKDRLGYSYCDDWQSDDMTRMEREK